MAKNDPGIIKKLNVARGQLEGVAKMIEQDRDCVDILIQLKAAKSAVGRLASLYAKQYFDSCIKQKRKISSKELEAIFKETV